MAGKTAKKPRIEAAKEAPRVWLTRDQARHRLGLSMSGLRGRVRLGLLEEHRDQRTGRPVYDSRQVDAQVDRLPPHRASSGGKRRNDELDPGEISARAFALFRSSPERPDVRAAVEKLKITVPEAEKLAADFVRLGGQHLLSADAVTKLRTPKMLNLPDGDPFTDDKLIAWITNRDKQLGDRWHALVKEAESERDKAQAEAKQLAEAIVQLQARLEDQGQRLESLAAARAAAERRASAAEAALAAATAKPAHETAPPVPDQPAPPSGSADSSR